MIGRVRNNGAQRLDCIAASAYRISKNKKKERVLNVLIFLPTICLAIFSVIAFIAMSLKTLFLYSLHLICQRQLRSFKSSMKIEVSFFGHSIEHIMKNISNL